MAATVTNVGTNTSTSSGSTLTLGSVTAAVGDWLVVMVAADNAGAGGAIAATQSVSDDAGNTYTLRNTVTIRDPGSANAGCEFAPFTCEVTSALSGGTITVNFSPNVTSKAILAYRVQPGSGETISFARASATGSVGGSTTQTCGRSVSVDANEYIFAGNAIETNTTVTGDSDTTDGSWSTMLTAVANTGSDLTSMTVSGQWKGPGTSLNFQSRATTTAASKQFAGRALVLLCEATATEYQQTVTAAVDASVARLSGVAKRLGPAVDLAGSMARSIGKRVLPSAALAASFRRAVARAVLVPVDLAPAFARSTGKGAGAAVSAAPSTAQAMLFVRTIAAAVDASAALSRGTEKLVSAGLNGLVTIGRGVSRTIGAVASVAATSTTSRAYLATVAAGIAAGVALSRSTGRIVQAGAGASASLRRSVAASLSAGLDAATTTARAVTRTLTALLKVSGAAEATRAFLVTVTAGIDVGVSLARGTGKNIAAVASSVVGTVKAVARPVVASLVIAPSIIAARALLLVLSAAVGAGATMARSTTAQVSALVTGAASVRSAVAVSLSAGASMTANAVRQVARSIAAGLLSAVDLIAILIPAGGALYEMTVTASAKAGVSVRRSIAVTLSAATGVIATVLSFFWRPSRSGVESDADRAALLGVGEFGVPVVWQTADDQQTLLAGLFTAPWASSDYRLTALQPQLLCRSIDLPETAAQGDRVTARGVVWRVREIRPDGTGMTIIDLQR